MLVLYGGVAGAEDTRARVRAPVQHTLFFG